MKKKKEGEKIRSSAKFKSKKTKLRNKKSKSGSGKVKKRVGKIKKDKVEKEGGSVEKVKPGIESLDNKKNIKIKEDLEVKKEKGILGLKEVSTGSIFSKTKPKLKNIERVSTGISNLDSITEKGFEKNSTNLIIGSSGSGKSIFGVQFLIEGIEKKENCMFISFEEGKETFYQNLKKLGWDLEKLEKQDKFYFLEYTPKKVKIMLDEGGGIIESLVLRKKITRIVIDSLTSFILLFNDELKQRESTLSLFNLLKGWDCTSLLTYEGDNLKEDKLKSKILEFESDSIIALYFLRNKNERKRYLEVLKMRATNHSKKIHEFSIGKKGILLSKKVFSGELR